MASCGPGRVAGGSAYLRRAIAYASRVFLPTLAALAVAATAPGAPLEVYGRLPRLEDLALSPDGSRIAFVKTDGNARFVEVYSVADHAVVAGARAGEQKLRYVKWADRDHLLIVTSVTAVPFGFIGPQSEWYQLQVYDLKSKRIAQLPEGDADRGVKLLNAIGGRVMVRHVKDRTVLFVRGLQMSGELVPALIRIDLETHNSRVIQAGTGGNYGWVVDDAGEIAAQETYDDSNRHWSISIRRDGRMREAVSGTEQIDFPRLLGWGPTAESLLFERLEDGDPVWRLLSLKDGSLGSPMAGTQALDEPIDDPVTTRMIGGIHQGDFAEYVFFDPAVQQSWEEIVRTFPGEHVEYESAAAGFRRVIVRVAGAKHGLVYALADLDAHHATLLGPEYDGLTELLEAQRINYPAADGLKIPAYLTLPRGKPVKALPLVVLPHGGPEARDNAEFDWWSQALADQGYAVLRPNYRGSSLGWAFVSKGFGEWGRKMQTDLSDGVRALAKEGIIDPARVCIVGASYGGYAALAGPSLDPGVYRCAVAVAGISDIRRMLTWVNDQQGSGKNLTQRYWDRYMGVSGPDDPAVATISPIRHLDAITVPILLIHGKDDTVVPFEQSQGMYDLLRKQGKDAQLVVLKGEDHWLSRSSTRQQMLEASVAFLRAHNPPD